MSGSAYLPLLLIARPWWTLSDLSLTLPDSQSWFFFPLALYFALSSCLSTSPLLFPPTLVYDEPENMLTAIPSVLLIKTLAVMGVATRRRATGACQCWSVFGDGEQVSWISPVFAWLLQQKVHNTWAILWCSCPEIHVTKRKEWKKAIRCILDWEPRDR